MKASSESGEWASLISRVSVEVFEVALPVMGMVVPFVPQRLPLLVRCANPLREIRVSSGKHSRRRRKREDVSDAGVARHVLQLAAQSLAYRHPSRQTFWWS